jgi:N utilization substance protein B
MLYWPCSMDPTFPRADAEYFRAALQAVCDGAPGLDEALRPFSDIQPERLDPIEHAILQLGLWELMTRPDVPYRVVINEAVELAKRYGSTDGHRYVNAVLDQASRAHRALERGEVA